MNFGEALEALKYGKKVAREGWNGKGMFIYLTAGREIPMENLFPEPAGYLQDVFKKGDMVKINSHIDMKAADNSLVIGWLASQTDIQANDWVVLD